MILSVVKRRESKAKDLDVLVCFRYWRFLSFHHILLLLLQQQLLGWSRWRGGCLLVAASGTETCEEEGGVYFSTQIGAHPPVTGHPGGV